MKKYLSFKKINKNNFVIFSTIYFQLSISIKDKENLLLLPEFLFNLE
jgi:hypothetical protein